MVEDGLVLAAIGRCALVDRLGVGGGRIHSNGRVLKIELSKFRILKNKHCC